MVLHIFFLLYAFNKKQKFFGKIGKIVPVKSRMYYFCTTGGFRVKKFGDF